MLVTTLLVRPCHALLVTADSASADMAYTDLVSAETHREWTFPVLKDTQSVTQCCSATALIGSTMYQLGGADIDGNPVATVFSYNLNTMAVGPQLNSMPTARYNLGAGVFDLGNVVYAVGGRTLSGSPTRDGMATTALEAYNVAKGSWAQLTGMPTARAELGVAVVDVLLYAIGGSVGSAETTSALECFNPATGKWHTLESMPTSRATFATGVIGVSIYVAGGICMSSDGKPWPPLPLSTMETYNTETGKWTTLDAMPTARFWVAGSVVNNLFYATGGTASNGAGWAVGVSGVQSQTDFFSARHQTTSGMGACNGCWSESFSPSTGWEKLEDIPISEIGGQNIWWNCIEVISATMYGMILGTNNVTFVEYSCTSNWGGLDCSDCDAIHFGTTCSEPVPCSTDTASAPHLHAAALQAPATARHVHLDGSLPVAAQRAIQVTMVLHVLRPSLATSTTVHVPQPLAAAPKATGTAQPARQAGHLQATAQIVTSITSVPPAQPSLATLATAPANPRPAVGQKVTEHAQLV